MEMELALPGAAERQNILAQEIEALGLVAKILPVSVSALAIIYRELSWSGRF